MIRGRVTADAQAVVTLHLRGPSGTAVDIEAVVDSGFNDTLTIPPDLVARLGLNFEETAKLTMANGDKGIFDMYQAEIQWRGAWRRTEVWSVGDAILIGMRLMTGHRLAIDVIPGGAVEITPLS